MPEQLLLRKPSLKLWLKEISGVLQTVSMEVPKLIWPTYCFLSRNKSTQLSVEIYLLPSWLYSGVTPNSMLGGCCWWGLGHIEPRAPMCKVCIPASGADSLPGIYFLLGNQQETPPIIPETITLP